MLKISTKKFDPVNWPEGVWATYAEGVRFKIRKLRSDVMRELRKPYVTSSLGVNPITNTPENVETVDKDKLAEVMADFLIEDFEGIGDDEGVVLPVNLDSKKALMSYPHLREFITSISQALEVIAAKKEDTEVKD